MSWMWLTQFLKNIKLYVVANIHLSVWILFICMRVCLQVVTEIPVSYIGESEYSDASLIILTPGNGSDISLQENGDIINKPSVSVIIITFAYDYLHNYQIDFHYFSFHHIYPTY